MFTKIKAESHRSIVRWAQWLTLLCFIDAIATDTGIRLQLIVELNPLAKLLYEQHVVFFYTYKIGLPLILLALLPYIRKESIVRTFVFGTMILYALLALYHLGWLMFALT